MNAQRVTGYLYLAWYLACFAATLYVVLHGGKLVWGRE